MATHSSLLAWRIPWTEEPGGLQCTGPQRIGHNKKLTLLLSFTGGPVVKTLRFHCKCLIPVWGTTIPHVVQHDPKKKKERER